MLHVIQSWLITLETSSNQKIKFKIYDDHFTNVLKKFAEISFEEEFISVTIMRETSVAKTLTESSKAQIFRGPDTGSIR